MLLLNDPPALSVSLVLVSNFVTAIEYFTFTTGLVAGLVLAAR